MTVQLEYFVKNVHYIKVFEWSFVHKCMGVNYPNPVPNEFGSAKVNCTYVATHSRCFCGCKIIVYFAVVHKINKFDAYYPLYSYVYTTLTPKIKEKGMHIYLISHTQLCDIKNIAHLSVRYKKYRTLILIKTFQTNLKSFYEMMISH